MALIKKTFHTLTLGFTAFWLVATSRAPEPRRPCFVPLKAEKVEITLGALRPASPASSSVVPSCQGLDGLREGGVIRVGLIPSSERTFRSHGDSGDACLGYEVTELTEPTGLSQQRSGVPRNWAPRALFEADALFTSDQTATPCSGEYHISVAPVNPIPPNALIDPLGAGHRESWHLRRAIRVPSNHVCALSPAVPPGDCEDIFEVKSLALVP